MCWWIWHQWSPWAPVADGQVWASPNLTARAAGITEDAVVGHWLRQERQCVDCGLVQQRMDRVRL